MASTPSPLPTSEFLPSTSIPTPIIPPTTWPSTLIGPLTTIFTPPSSCINDVYLPTSPNADGTWLWLNLGPTSTDICLPPGWGPSAYYSPARCPYGYSTNGVTVVDSETQAICCPTNSKMTFTLRPGTSPTPSWYPTELCQTQPSTGVAVFPVTTYVGAGSSSIIGSSVDIVGSSVDPNGLINAYGISIRWKEGDFPASVPATPTATQSVDHAPASDGLSTGAKAGVGVGVSLAVLLAIGIAILFFLRRKKGQGARVPSQDGQYMGDAGYGQNPYGKNQYGLGAYQQDVHELPSGQDDELSNYTVARSSQFKSKPVELDSR